MGLSNLEVLMNAQMNLETFQEMNPAVARHPIFMIAKQQLDNGIKALEDGQPPSADYIEQP